jgi:hypothetical protein
MKVFNKIETNGDATKQILYDAYKYERLLKGFTYLFEILYFENRIVCQ